ncbi:hypothetical protein WI29_13225 [Burkholderia ubonensis]|nr:hypothetical protein WI31_02755 [Burkholderia ubonensis]KUZ23148.1 hypothetical protein WI29_13225 [Burkholderia ubonensis]KUZ31031.1 hypothetical protein WI32_23920 [Burkholderia ubonensis]KUZ31698.1 hypothetical protein WI30_17785 [Burkholderia ubonensis]KUZ50955.1 hypothetical protein WI34_30670 [Burkholderia ubonensis]
MKTLSTPRSGIELRDRFESMSAQMVKQVAAKTSDVAGDGTTTATVLAQVIVREGMKYVAAGPNPMDPKRDTRLRTLRSAPSRLDQRAHRFHQPPLICVKTVRFAVAQPFRHDRCKRTWGATLVA